jgi:NADH-quinone oxidoreductase subunit C
MKSLLQECFPKYKIIDAFDELTLIVDSQNIVAVCKRLKDNLNFDTLIDIAGIDYLHYGQDEWHTDVSSSGFGRSKNTIKDTSIANRYAIAYHLLSTTDNTRLRVRTYLPDNLQIESVIGVWSVADWFEREAFDLFGFLFKNHPDLRRILTDYGFIGHPLRKDFPTVGEVQMRYDEKQQRVVYEEVDIELEPNVPKVIQ